MEKKGLTDKEIRILNKTLKLISSLDKKKIVSDKKKDLELIYRENKLFTNKTKYKLFSAKEIKVIILICSGFTNKEIGVKLRLSKRTIDGIRILLLKKTESANVVGLVKYAIKNKIYLLK